MLRLLRIPGASLIALLVVAACSGDKSGPTGPVASMLTVKVSSALVYPGDLVTLAPSVVDQHGAPMQTSPSDFTTTLSDTMPVVETSRLTFRAMQPGEVAVHVAGRGLSSTVRLTVRGEPVAHVVVTIPDTVRYGAAFHPTVKLTAADGSTLSGRRVGYLVSPAGVATVSADTAVALKQDTTVRTFTITVTSEGVVGTSNRTTATRAPVGAVTFQASRRALWTDSLTATATLSARDSLGDVIGSSEVRVAASDPSVMSIAGAYPGVLTLTGLKPGESSIAVTVRGRPFNFPYSVYAPARWGIKFIFTDSVPARVRTAMQAAAHRWGQVLQDTINRPHRIWGTGSCFSRDTTFTPDSLPVFVDIRDAAGGFARGGPCGYDIIGDWRTGRWISQGGLVYFDRQINFDSPALTDAIFIDVATHELGHVLGSGTVSMLPVYGFNHNTLADTVLGPPYFASPRTLAVWASYGATGWGGLAGIPLATSAVPLSMGAHWREGGLFTGEVMGIGAGAAISRLTLAQLADVGRVVRPEYADPWAPTLTAKPTSALMAAESLVLDGPVAIKRDARGHLVTVFQP